MRGEAGKGWKGSDSNIEHRTLNPAKRSKHRIHPAWAGHRRGLRAGLRLFRIALALILTGCARPPAVPTTFPPPTSVDGEAALTEVTRFVALGPRVSGTPGASRAAAYLVERLHDVGYRPLLDAFQAPAPGGDMAFANVIGIPPGVPGRTLKDVLVGSTQPIMILLSHYDTKAGVSETFAGANDSGSSTGLLLHLADLLADRGTSSPLVLPAFVDGEECRLTYGPADGLHGSRHLAMQIAESGQADRVRAVIVLDMIGDRDLNIRIPHNTTRPLLAAVFEAAQAEGVRKQFGISKGSILDDHVPFLERKIPAIDLIDFQYGSAPGLNDYWHTPADTMDKLSAQSLETVGRVVMRVLHGSLGARALPNPR